MARSKHRPQRTCIACRTTGDKNRFVRIVKTPTQQLIVDLTGKANGRGAYLCLQPGCWDKGLQLGRLAHALKVKFSAEDVANLRAELDAALNQTPQQ